MPRQYLCIHGHFYQPPREDPVTGIIPLEEGSAPYENWNERIHAECYQPNAHLGNFEQISFNLGPTLCAWMAAAHPETLQSIVRQERVNYLRYGCGNAMAQPYNHTILPLASRQDKITQVVWGIADFEYRFGHKPLGMWLPETAVDLETLEVLADCGIRFTILAPWQSTDPHLDVRFPHRVSLSAGRSLVVFFYERGLSTGISFNPSWTNNADDFIRAQLLPVYQAGSQANGQPRLVTLASDGELYGHHQPLRDYFLAHLVNGASHQADLTPVFPSLWLNQFPVKSYTTILENTSWSCQHALTRWSGECDCTPGGNQWKYHLRSALDWLSQELDKLYLSAISNWVADPWELRNAYIQVMLGQRSAADLIAEMAGHQLPAEAIQPLDLYLQAQYERQRMYTSCGWFFEDFDRIEPRNNLAYAAQAVRLVQLASGENLAPEMVKKLEPVLSLRSGLRGSQVFLDHLKIFKQPVNLKT